MQSDGKIRGVDRAACKAVRSNAAVDLGGERTAEVGVVEALKSPAEQRVLLRNVSWETYERLVAEREECRAPRFFL